MPTLKGKKVSLQGEYLSVELEDGRIILTPLKWYALLWNAKIAELHNYRFICDKTGIEWESLDYHLSIESMLKEQIKSA